MRKPPRLQKRGHRFYCRVAVPHGLREILGKREIIRALGTGDYAEAIRRLPLKSAEVNSELAAAKRKLSAMPAIILGEFEAKELAVHWLWEQERSVEIPPDIADDYEEVLHVDIATLVDANNPNTLASIQTLALRILENNNLKLDPTSADFHRLCELLRRAALERANRCLARFHGDYAATFDPVFEKIGLDGSKPLPTRPKIALSELCQKFLADPARGRVSDKTRVDYNFTFRLLLELLGQDKPVDEIARAECRKVCEILSVLPPNAGKRWPGTSLKDVAASAQKNNIAPMAARTANAYLQKLSALFRWAQQEEFVDKNPAIGLRVAKEEVHKRDARLPLDTEQLRKLFAAPLYVGCLDDGYGYDKPGPNIIKRWRYWLLPIALHSGMRLNEICSLQLADIEELEGIPCFRVRLDPSGEKRLKTASAERSIPVHPKLIRMGLLEYVAELRERNEKWLWPELLPDKRGYRSDAAQKWFGRFLAKSGAKKPRTSFHSTRHCFRDALREVDAPRDVVQQLGGWAGNGGTSDLYGDGLKTTTLFEWIKKIDYPELT